MELPVNLLPSGVLNKMRAVAEQFFTTSGTVYSVSFTHAPDGRQIPASSVVFSSNMYIGKMTGDDLEFLEQMGFSRVGVTGTENMSKVTILAPFANEIKNTHVIHIQGKAWYVIWSSAETQDSVQVYQKALCIDRLMVEEGYQMHG
jgi:hypothetical protein